MDAPAKSADSPAWRVRPTGISVACRAKSLASLLPSADPGALVTEAMFTVTVVTNVLPGQWLVICPVIAAGAIPGASPVSGEVWVIVMQEDGAGCAEDSPAPLALSPALRSSNATAMAAARPRPLLVKMSSSRPAVRQAPPMASSVASGNPVYDRSSQV